ncbi:MAG: DUF58 domain-containing protein [Candidatus Binataceae bacterium]
MLGLPEEFSSEFLARLEQLRIKTRREYAGSGKGGHLSPRRGTSLEFKDFRHYALGDDFRYIDWGLYGRTDKLYIKLFKEEEDLLTYIFLDASASMALPAGDRKFELGIVTALALAYIALSAGDRVMVRVLGGAGSPPLAGFVFGRHRIVELARSLTSVRPAGEIDFAHTLASELLSIRRAGKVFILSDYLMTQDSVERGLGLFTAANMDVTAVHILGGRELDGAGLEGDLELIDAESGETLRLALGQRERQRHRETLMRLSRGLKAFCLKRGLHYSLYVTSASFHDFFLRAVAELGLVH